MMHIAIHDALNAIDPRYRPYAASLAAPATASPEAAVAAAARGVLDPLLHQIPAPFPPECGAAGAAQVEADYAAAIAAIPAGTARTDGVAAGDDGNPRTTGDPTWTPLRPTPPIPDHDSAHAVEGAVAARVMARVLGTDRVRFDACSRTLPAGSTCTDAMPVTRHYTSSWQAAEENGLSRILIGFHFRNAVDRGLEHGAKIGDRAVDRYLRPNR